MRFYLKEVIIKPVGVLMASRQLGVGLGVQRYVDSEVLRLMAPYTPLESGALIGSATALTAVGSGKINQQTPYAARWHYEPANFNGAPMRGNKWFDRMKADHKDNILQGASAIAGAKVG